MDDLQVRCDRSFVPC